MFRLRPLSLLSATLVLLLAVGIAACGAGNERATPSLVQPEQAGEELVTRYTTLVANKDVPGLEGFLSEAFIIQRANGVFNEKADYLANLPDIGNFRVSNVTARQDGEALIVRWTLSVDQVVDNVKFSTEPAPRLSSFKWSGGQWRLTSHANFNVPVPESQ